MNKKFSTTVVSDDFNRQLFIRGLHHYRHQRYNEIFVEIKRKQVGRIKIGQFQSWYYNNYNLVSQTLMYL